MNGSIERERRQARVLAIASILIGTTCILSVTLVYFLYGDWLDLYMQQEPTEATNAFLIRAIKASAFRLVPGLCILLIAVGVGNLRYIKKEEKELAPQQNMLKH